MYSPSAATTSNAHLTGTTAGMIVTAVVAILGLTVLLGMVFLADGLPFTRRTKRGEASEGGPAGQLPDGQGDRPWEQISDRHLPEGGYSHGRPASWVLVAVVLAAALTGGISIITHSWWLLWACIAIAVLAVPAGKMIGIMDDSVDWGSTPAAAEAQPPAPEADHGRGQPAQIRRAWQHTDR